MFPPCPLILRGWCTIKADVEVTAPVTVHFGGRVWLAKTSINHGQIRASVCSKRTPEETSAIPNSSWAQGLEQRTPPSPELSLLNVTRNARRKATLLQEETVEHPRPCLSALDLSIPAWSKGQWHPGWLSLAMLLQAASKPDNHFRNKMEIQGLIFANIINSFFSSPLPLLPLSTMSGCILLNCCQP